ACTAEADRTCTKCGRPCCSVHCGLRSCSDGPTPGTLVVTCAFCANCAQDHRSLKVLLCILGSLMFVSYLACVPFGGTRQSNNKVAVEQPEWERQQRENWRKWKPAPSPPTSRSE